MRHEFVRRAYTLKAVPCRCRRYEFLWKLMKTTLASQAKYQYLAEELRKRTGSRSQNRK